MNEPTVATTQPLHPRSRWWVWVVIAVVIIGTVGGVYWLVKRAGADSAAKGDARRQRGDTPVVVAQATRRNLQLYLSGLGTVTPFNTVAIRSRVDGAIIKVAYHEGELVKKDQDLLLIDPGPYQAALDQAQGQLDKDTAASKYAESQVKRDNEALASLKGSISTQALDTDMEAQKQAEAAIEVDKAMKNNAQINLDYCHIKSPIDGQIGLRKVDEGNIVHSSDTTPLAVVTQLKPITVLFTLAEDDIKRVRTQMATGAPVTVLAFDRDLTTPLGRGTLLALDNQIDVSSGTVQLRARFDNDDMRLFPQQFVNAKLLVETEKDATVVPSAAIQPGNDSAYVYVVSDITTGDRPQGTVHMRPVKTGASQSAIGPQDEDLTAITSGLVPGDTVVIDGVDKLIDGAKVSVRPLTRAAPTTQDSMSTTESATTGPSTTQPASGSGGAPRRGGRRRGG